MIEDLVGVQPMQDVFPPPYRLEVKYKSRWSDWCKKFVFFPRKSINGKLIFGFVHYRESMNAWGYVPLSKSHPDAHRQWATSKEVFVERLAGEANE